MVILFKAFVFWILFVIVWGLLVFGPPYLVTEFGFRPSQEDFRPIFLNAVTVWVLGCTLWVLAVVKD